MTKPHTLIISTGNQDLKIICKKTENCTDSKIELREIGKFGRRLLHEAFLDNRINYKIITNEEALQTEISKTDSKIQIPQGWENTKGKFLDPNFDKSTNTLDSQQPFKQDFWKNRAETQRSVTEALVNAEGKYLLFPAKLHTVIQSIQKENIQIKAGRVFYTDRKKCKLNLDWQRKNKLNDQYNQEPVATGKLIAEWLKSIFSGSDFQAVNFLDGLYAFEGNAVIQHSVLAPYDQPIAQKASHIIDSAIKKLADANPDTTAIVSHTGGIADSKAILTPSARLHFHGNILELHDSEHIPNDPVCLSNSNQNKCRILPRNTILEAKHQASMRLWEGDFAGAWAVVSHIQDEDPDLPCDTWVTAIKKVADYMEGYSNQAPFADATNLTDKQKEILWKAFQVEAALQNQSGGALIIRLLRALGTFREVVEKALIEKQLTTEGFEFGKGGIIKQKSEKFNDKYNDFIFKIRNGKTVYSTTANNKRFINLLDYSEDIKKFFELMEKNISRKNAKSLRNYRNDITHNQPPVDKISQIEQYGIETNLWNTTRHDFKPQNLGTCFLAMPMLQAIFEALDLNNPAPTKRYQSMLETLQQTIFEPIPVNCP